MRRRSICCCSEFASWILRVSAIFKTTLKETGLTERSPRLALDAFNLRSYVSDWWG